MAKATKSRSMHPAWWILIVLVVLGMVGGGIYAGVKLGGDEAQQTSLEDKQQTGEEPVGEYFGTNLIPSATIEFNAMELASGAQDDEDDLDFDVLEWNPDRNDDLKAKHYIDCAGVEPAIFDGKNTFVDVTEANMCEVNIYKAWQSFTAGDFETKLAEELTKTQSDMGDIDADDSAVESVVIKTAKTYLVALSEAADADEDDVIPTVFLIKLADRTTFAADEIAAGNIKVRFNVKYFSDATAASKTRVFGECSDDEENDVTLDSSLNGFVSSQLTAATTITSDCKVEVEVVDEGYALKLENPLANSNSERAYIQIDPYGTNSSGSWVEYGATGLTGDIGYSATAANSSIIWQGLDVCGKVITDDSGSDAVKLGGEKLYQGSDVSCIKDVFHRGGSDPSLTIPLTLSEITVDYDAATDGDNGQLDAASGSSPEAIADINLVGLEATTDIVAQAIAG